MNANIDSQLPRLQAIARQVRRWCLEMTTGAGSGHVTSAFSATDLMVGLCFAGFFRYDAAEPAHPNNDRLIFSKGHASPLFYALWAAAGKIDPAQLRTFREFGSTLEGHPTRRFPFTEAATGSLGQGLGIGLGMALNARYLDDLGYRTFVLLGDSEMAEGSQWEAIQLAAHYRLANLVGILDVNRLGQRGETMLGRDARAYAERLESFGWRTRVIDGHAFPEILDAFAAATGETERPYMIIARTVKGKGVSFLEDTDGWHGKPVPEDRLGAALQELGAAEITLPAEIPRPDDAQPSAVHPLPAPAPEYERGQKVATRKAYGAALARLGDAWPQLVVLDAEVSNSTGAERFAHAAPTRFFEMFIAEQAMIEAAVGLALRGKIPFASTFAAFFSRAFDQIRMAQYSDANIKLVGSHAGVSIGEDGASQMGLEDFAMFRAVPGAVVLHPCDALSTEKLVEAAAAHPGMVYLRTLRQATPVLYSDTETFPIGGSKTLRSSERDVATIVAVGATVHEALAAHARLQTDGIAVRVIDAYSVHPLDAATLRRAANETGAFVTVEDHHAAGGLGEAVLASLAENPRPTEILAVRKRPLSGKGDELREYAGISADAITAAVMRLLGARRDRLVEVAARIG
ncbi:MAG TPA: transketolase [Opitutaceae bacterium]|nr:transketolase [Opitutaceae bacterium]